MARGGNRRNNDLSVRDNDVVYAIRRLSDGAIKFGKTQNVHNRLLDFRSMYGEVEIIATMRGYTEAERRVLAELDEYRICITEFRLSIFRPEKRKYKTPRKTEWCYPASAVLRWIEQNMTPYTCKHTAQRNAYTTDTTPPAQSERLAS
jgi:hypothetical protein